MIKQQSDKPSVSRSIYHVSEIRHALLHFSTSPPKGTRLTKLHRLDSFPSSAAFDAIHSSLQSDDAERKDAIKKGNAVFAFTLKNQQGQTDTWHIDLKEKGEVAKGEAPSGKKADGQ